MKVFGFSSNKNVFNPHAEGKRFGLTIRFQGGDVYRPNIKDAPYRPGREGEDKGWFNTLPTKAIRFKMPLPILPFLSIGIGKYGFYVGFKTFSMNYPEYVDLPRIKPEDVYEGSMALTPSIRKTTKRGE